MTGPAAPVPQPPQPPAPQAPKITIDDFKKLQLRVGRVLEVQAHPNADRLYVLKVDLGTETRQLVAGLRPFYPDPQALVGRNVVVVANLQPATLRGVESQGMILAASKEVEGKLVDVCVLAPERDVPPGSKVS